MIRPWLRIIAMLEVIGGAVGSISVIWWLSVASVNGPTVLLAFIPVAVYAFSLIAGIGLWRGSSFGHTASIIVQAIQLPKIISPPLIFMFSFGFDFWVYFAGSKAFATLGFQFNFLAFYQLSINTQGAPLGVGISVIALFFMGLLLKYRGQPREEVLLPPPPPPPNWE